MRQCMVDGGWRAIWGGWRGSCLKQARRWDALACCRVSVTHDTSVTRICENVLSSSKGQVHASSDYRPLGWSRRTLDGLIRRTARPHKYICFHCALSFWQRLGILCCSRDWLLEELLLGFKKRELPYPSVNMLTDYLQHRRDWYERRSLLHFHCH